jgi:hypothetical protein
MDVSGQLHASAALPPGRNTDEHFMGGWLGPELDWTFRRKENMLLLPGEEFKIS